MSTWDLDRLLNISNEEWDCMPIEEQTLILERLEQLLEEEGLLQEFDRENGPPPHRTLQ